MKQLISKLEDVKNSGLCMGCGACAGVCPSFCVTMAESSKGSIEPQIIHELCNECGLCLKVCPGYELDFVRITKEIYGSYPDNVELGHFRALYSGHSTDYDLRQTTQSGGMVSTLLIHLLEVEKIDGAVVTRWYQDNPFATETFIAKTREEILSASLSKYVPVPADEIIRFIIDTEGRYAFVGTPCQIHGLRKTERVLPLLKDRIVLYVGLHCQGVFTRYFPRHILAMAGVKEEDVKQFFFRSKARWGWPCHVRIETIDGMLKDIRREKSTVPIRSFYSLYRCLMCFDKLNELADITFGDCRIPRHYSVSTMAEVEKNGAFGESDIIVRTFKGESALNSAVESGAVEVKATTSDELLRSTRVSAKKLGIATYMATSIVGKALKPIYDIKFQPEQIHKRHLLKLLSPISISIACLLSLCWRVGDYGFFRKLLRRTPIRFLWLLTSIIERLSGPGVLRTAKLNAAYLKFGDVQAKNQMARPSLPLVMFRWAVAFFTLFIVTKFLIGHSESIKNVLGFRFHHIGGICILTIAYTVIRSYRLLLITRSIGDIKLGFSKWFKIFIVGRFTNVLAPQLGNMYRAVMLKKHYNLSFHSYISSFAFFAWLDILLNFALALVLMVLIQPGLTIAGVNAGLAIAGLFFSILFLPFVAGRILSLWGPDTGILAKTLAVIKDLLVNMAEQRCNIKLMVSVTVLGIVTFGLGVLSFALLFDGIGVLIHWTNLALFLAFYNMSLYLTITPGNIGVREIIFGALASALGVGMAEGIIASAVHRVAVYIFLFPLGMFFGGLHLFGKTRFNSDKERDKTL